jgi:CHRD domain-containing protein
MRRWTAAVVAVALLACASSASAATYTFNVTLTNTWLLGDPGASGTASITMNDAGNQVCWAVSTSGLSGVTSGGIYAGGAGQPASAVAVVPFTTFPSGCTLSGAVAVMVRCPAQFNVTIRTPSHPGALRGQLGTRCSI